MGVDPRYQLSPDALNGIFVKSSTGAMVPLSAIAKYQASGPRCSQSPGSVSGRYAHLQSGAQRGLGDAVIALQKVQGEMNMPSTIHATFQGTAQAFQDSLKNEPWLILAALVAVYIVLGILYESLIHPLTILSTLPPAGVGAILALLSDRNQFQHHRADRHAPAHRHCGKNAIMMIDFALQAEREQGLPPIEAIYQACLLRFRPIMMTTMSALFAGLPLAIGMGVGSNCVSRWASPLSEACSSPRCSPLHHPGGLPLL